MSSPNYPDRQLHVEEALEAPLAALAQEAEAAGWTPDETAFALLKLSVARILTLDANAATDETIARAIASVHGNDRTPAAS